MHNSDILMITLCYYGIVSGNIISQPILFTYLQKQKQKYVFLVGSVSTFLADRHC